MEGSCDIVTFRREKKDTSTSRNADKRDQNKAPAGTKNATQTTSDSGSKTDDDRLIPARWRRKGALLSKTENNTERQAYVSELKHHFAEVDAFELAVETPTPAKSGVNSQMVQDPLKARAMSMGLSRRSSMALVPSHKVSKEVTLPSLLSRLVSTPQTDREVKQTILNSNKTAKQGSRRSSSSNIINRLSHMISGRVQDLLHPSKTEAICPVLVPESPVTIDPLDASNRFTQYKSPVAGLFAIAEDLETVKPSSDFQDNLENSLVELQESLEEKLILNSEPALLPNTPLEQLLRLCCQEAESSELPDMDTLLRRYVDLEEIRKIGEGTFGEAFKAGKTVLKIVPMEGSNLVNGEPQKKAQEMLAEAAITATLSALREEVAQEFRVGHRSENRTSGFIEAHGIGVCCGAYSSVLCEAWKRWDAENTSENDPVDAFAETQLYVIFVVADGGRDLEHFELQSFAELRSILFQVTLTLAIAEDACQFEHRDLHWGNLLIDRDGSNSIPFRWRGIDVSVEALGLRVTLIDFTLSRLLTSEGDVAFCDLSADPALFNGPKGDAQAETYRRMQVVTQGKWQKFVPATNVLWLRYLADIMLSSKLPANCPKSDRLLLRNFRKATNSAQAAGELVWNDIFAGLWTSSARSQTT